MRQRRRRTVARDVTVAITVPDAARRTGRHPETIRRWIREGKLAASKVGTQHLIEERDLAAMLEIENRLAAPEAWARTSWGTPMPDVVAALRRSRAGH
jgi:excisionase family DNA binding protein